MAVAAPPGKAVSARSAAVPNRSAPEIRVKAKFEAAPAGTEVPTNASAPVSIAALASATPCLTRRKDRFNRSPPGEGAEHARVAVRPGPTLPDEEANKLDRTPRSGHGSTDGGGDRLHQLAGPVATSLLVVDFGVLRLHLQLQLGTVRVVPRPERQPARGRGQERRRPLRKGYT